MPFLSVIVAKINKNVIFGDYTHQNSGIMRLPSSDRAQHRR
jgi:hypothetical protein